MGVSSTHMAFENMIASGIPTGGRRNVAEDRMDDRRLAATSRHRCIRNHRLAAVPAEHLVVLEVAYSGEDWTRGLDEAVGRGPRVELQRLYAHEVLQVALLTKAVKVGLERTQAVASGAVGSEPVYHDGRSTIAELAGAVCLTTFDDERATVDAARQRLAELHAWVKKGGQVSWAPKPPDVLAALRVVLGQRKADHRVTVSDARKSLSAALKKAVGPRSVAYVVRHGVPTGRTLTSPRDYVLALLRAGNKKQLDRIGVEATVLLKLARTAAGVASPEQFRRTPRPRRHATPDVAPLSALNLAEGVSRGR